MILTAHLLNADRRRPQASKRPRKSPHRWVGQKEKQKRREKKESGQHQHPLEGTVKEERFLHTGRCPDWWGNQLAEKGSFQNPAEKCSSFSEKSKAERGPHRRSVPPPNTSQMLKHWGGQVPDTEAWALEARPGENTSVGCM